MSYNEKEFTCSNNESRGCEAKVVPLPMQTMTDLVRETGNIAMDILVMARRVNGHLFGKNTANCESKEAEPRCFRDEMEKTKETLLNTAAELSKILESLGA